MMEVENELNEQSKKLELLNRVQSSSLFNSRSSSVPNDEEGSVTFQKDMEADSLPIYSDEFLQQKTSLPEANTN